MYYDDAFGTQCPYFHAGCDSGRNADGSGNRIISYLYGNTRNPFRYSDTAGPVFHKLKNYG